MIEAHGLTKRNGDKLAVDDITFIVQPGLVTGFLGPNGAGKSTTMRMIVGLDYPTAGSVTVNGRPFAKHAAPLREVGALLEAKGVHTGRSARNHLLAMAATHGIATKRVDEVISMTGLEAVAGKRVGGFSLGMGQRLGIAAALLADPATLVLDEPVNGLDPEGVLWVRQLLRSLAREGRTVLLSSHLITWLARATGRPNSPPRVSATASRMKCTTSSPTASAKLCRSPPVRMRQSTGTQRKHAPLWGEHATWGAKRWETCAGCSVFFAPD